MTITPGVYRDSTGMYDVIGKAVHVGTGETLIVWRRQETLELQVATVERFSGLVMIFSNKDGPGR